MRSIPLPPYRVTVLDDSRERAMHAHVNALLGIGTWAEYWRGQDLAKARLSDPDLDLIAAEIGAAVEAGEAFAAQKRLDNGTTAYLVRGRQR